MKVTEHIDLLLGLSLGWQQQQQATSIDQERGNTSERETESWEANAEEKPTIYAVVVVVIGNAVCLLIN